MRRGLLIRKLVLWASAASCLLAACETPIPITLPHHDQTTVIEGWIENGATATVIISLSRPYYSKTTTDSILACIQTEAKVIVTDSNTGEWEELHLGNSSEHIYGRLGRAFIGDSIKGVPGHTYLLHIENKGKIFESSTYIPTSKVQIDSMYFNRPHSEESFIRILFTDPADEFNCYRFFTKVKSEDPGFAQVGIGTFDDLTFNGKQLNFELTRTPYSNILGLYYNDMEELKSSAMFKQGSTIYVKSSMVDEATKTYWFALQVDLTMGSNLFMAPGSYKTNIRELEGGSVTGIWSGYNSRYDTLIFHKRSHH
ncbi:MAG: DUF4249 family protein [Bacteroidales bacterium]|nr:DUF4249 family protein [Bacteroidales bacterium]